VVINFRIYKGIFSRQKYRLLKGKKGKKTTHFTILFKRVPYRILASAKSNIVVKAWI
jgi:hypothetical protein